MIEHVIWKYPIQPGENRIMIPYPAFILSVDGGAQPHLWAMVVPGGDEEERRVLVMPTGRYFDATDLHFIGRFETPGNLVWHAFQEI